MLLSCYEQPRTNYLEAKERASTRICANPMRQQAPILRTFIQGPQGPTVMLDTSHACLSTSPQLPFSFYKSTHWHHHKPSFLPHPLTPPPPPPPPQLANLTSECIAEIQQAADETSAAAAEQNRWVVRCLYEAINARDVETVQKLLAQDIDWRFHGPPACQHMMRLLTGASDSKFEFVPLSVEAIGPDTVIVEGKGRDSLLWVHAWTVVDGVITQVREYFNTSVTVTRVGAVAGSSVAAKKAKASNCLPVWQSKLSERAGKSVPGLVLAI